MRTTSSWVILMAFLMAACSPSQADIERAIAETEAAKPTATTIPTPTPIPLSAIDLAPLLIKDGDLPAGVTGAQIRKPLGSDDIAEAVNSVFQQFQRSGNGMGGVTVWLFDNASALATEYDARAKHYHADELLADIGEKAVGVEPDKAAASVLGLPMDSLISEVLFVRCTALVHVVIPAGESGLVGAAAYAQNLDKRLAAAVCR